MLYGAENVFTFDTVPCSTLLRSSTFYDSPEGLTATGQVEAPVIRKTATTTTQAKPFVDWPDASRLPTAMFLRATVAGNAATGAPTGTVTCMEDGATAIGTAPLSDIGGGSASATLAAGAPTVGQHQITAVYSGDVNYTPSSSAVSRVDLEVAFGGDPQFPPNNQPVGANLTWANYGVPPANRPNAAAWTASLDQSRADWGTVTLTIVHEGVADAQAR